MFVGNTIKFGYGSVAVGAIASSRTLTLEYVEPPFEVGTKIRIEDLAESNRIGKLSFRFGEDMRTLRKSLKEISPENPTIEFRDYLFDFTNFNPESIRVLDEALLNAILGNTIPLAC